MDPPTIYTHVFSRYTASALSKPNPHAKTVAEVFGYSPDDLSSTPSEANLGLSCGNPLALASLTPDETVVDLGCGAGFDVFLAARRVGEKGRVVGVDMNEDMLSRARLSAAKLHSTNTSFVNSRITAVNLPDASADVVISNCVINLVPDAEKQIVFKEMHRILKPGGRVAVSDILIKKTLPAALKKNVALYVGCFAGASRKEEYEGWLADAGFADVMIVDAGSDLNVYTRGEGDAGCCGGGEEVNVEKEGCCGTSKQGSDGGVVADMKRDLSGVDLNECAGSFKIYAVKKV